MANTLSGERFPSQDGRIARGLRTRESILLAYEALIMDAPGPPTGAELAQRAGVSARSIFTHFGDMDGVLAAAARRAFDWMVETHVDVSPDLPLDVRVRTFTIRCAQVLERTAPLYRVFRSSRQGARSLSPAVSEVLAGVDQVRRRYIEFVFGRELAAGSDGEREILVEALVAVSSWNNWEALRVDQWLDAARARVVMERTLAGLFRIA